MRKLAISIATAVGLAASLSASGCGDDGGGGDAKKGGSITMAASAQPDSLDPALAYTSQSWEATWVVWTPPLTYKHEEGKAGGELIPGVAEDLPRISRDGRTYTFRIRKGLRYSDGTAVKASDWEHTIKRVLNLESGGSFYYESIDGASDYQEAGKARGDISGIETNDRTGEVTVRLTERDGTFLNVLALPFSGIVPADTPFENLTKEPPPGVGPYRIAESLPNREYVLERNRRFDIPGIPKGNIDRITTRIVESLSRQAQDVIRGRLDYMQDPPPQDLLPEIRSKYSDRYEEHSTVSTYYFFMNTRLRPFNKPEVRQAVNHALDSKALARLFGGRLEPSCNFLPETMPGYERMDPCPYGEPDSPGDPKKASELVRKAGERGAAVTVWSNNDTNRPEIGQYYTDLLNKIGLKAKLRTVDGGVYFQNVGNAKTKAQTGFANWFADFQHPRTFLSLMSSESIQPSNNENLGNVEDRRLDELIDRVEAGPAHDDEVQQAAAEADRRIVDRAYAAPYGTEKLSTFLSERMDFDNCSTFHPIFSNDYTSFCLK